MEGLAANNEHRQIGGSTLLMIATIRIRILDGAPGANKKTKHTSGTFQFLQPGAELAPLPILAQSSVDRVLRCLHEQGTVMRQNGHCEFLGRLYEAHTI